MPTVTATTFHNRTAALIKRAMKHPKNPIVVNKRGKKAVVLVDARYFAELTKRLGSLSGSVAARAIRRSLANIAAGRLKRTVRRAK